MIYFSDRDVVRKLAACGFLPLLPELLGVAAPELEIRYLVSLKGYLTRESQRLEKAKFQRDLIDFCASHTLIGAAASVEREQELLDGGMDPGEALLFAEAEHTGGIVVTGDKRALADYARLTTQTQRARIKIICWEMLLLRVHELKGFGILKTGCCEGIKADKMLSLAFSTGLATGEDHALECIRSYLQGVKAHSSDIVFDFG
jgi:hypothetical protein